MRRKTLALLLAVAVHIPAFAATVTYTYTGAAQSFVVPAGVTSVTIEAWGAQGGINTAGITNNLGGYATGALPVTPGSTLYVYVGGQPVGVAGGFNGGGAGDTGGAGGGGASDVRQGGSALADRVLVAAGGGGGGFWSGLDVVGGVGGGLTGGDGYRAPDYATNPGGRGATQTAGGADGTCISFNVTALAGSLGQGGTPLGQNCGCQGYGGGGGLYGGAGSGNCRGGGGGSSSVSLVTGGSTQAGARAGNGEVRITYDLAAAPVAVPTLNQWALLMIGVVLAGISVLRLRRQRRGGGR
ncbi:MAG: IPTL-CTERM sorting domain-containing protein [Rhodospirillaceae bacterium]|nr:IPTL-CTERM sorting domain-containing protein [Rhodospirillaceae bacterium]